MLMLSFTVRLGNKQNHVRETAPIYFARNNDIYDAQRNGRYMLFGK